MRNKKSIKNAKGITMVALVVTMVILLILSTVTITALVSTGIIGKTQEAKTMYSQKEAEEAMNMKITNAEIEKYAAGQTLPTLQELADNFCEDSDFTYVTTNTQKVASLNKITVGSATSIFTKLNSYPYEFEIDSSLRLASIDGVKVADTTTTPVTPTYDAVTIDSIASDWKIQNYSVKSGNMVFFDIVITKDTAWNVRWTNNIAKINIAPKEGRSFQSLDSWQGMNAGLISIGSTGYISVFQTFAWQSATIHTISCQGFYYVTQ